jgi:diaminopimelate dehydrogenase
MGLIKLAVVGYGNVGSFAVEAAQAAPDMELVGIVRRAGGEDINGVKVVQDIKDLGHVDVAILCSPTRAIEHEALKYLEMGINTVDSFDIHNAIVPLRRTLGEKAKASGAVAVIAAGWDPGSNSVIRAIMEAAAPRGVTYTNYGPGMSMGHSTVVRNINGVEDALSITIPLGTGVHRRMVYVQLKEGADFSKVQEEIRKDPYFVNDETHIKQAENISDFIDKGHATNIVRKGGSGQTHNQLFEFNMTINNPALTSQIMVCCARSTTRLAPGAYTMIEIPMADLLPGNKEDWIERLV